MLPAEESGTSEGRTPALNRTVRSVFVIGPDKRIKLMLIYPDDGPQLRRNPARHRFAAAHRQAQGRNAANWKQGDDVIIAGSVSDEEAETIFPAGWKAPKPINRPAETRIAPERRRTRGRWAAGIQGGELEALPVGKKAAAFRDDPQRLDRVLPQPMRNICHRLACRGFLWRMTKVGAGTLRTSGFFDVLG
jgi:hypothetical protein